jgi:hypothetical protein
VELTSGTDKEKDQLLGGSVKLSALLKQSPFGQAGIENITVNWKKKTVAILLNSKEGLPGLLQTGRLGEFNILCSQPGSHVGVSGKIGPINGDVSVEEIQKILYEREDQQGIRVIRLQKGTGHEKVPAMTVRLVFPGETLPPFVYFGYRRFRVSLYVDKPLQCFKCQGFGHGSRQCGGKEVCVICAGPHALKDCPKTEGQVKCVNCGGAHTASYGGCILMKTAFQLEKVRAVQKVTYSEALAVVNQKKDGINPERVNGKQGQGTRLGVSYSQMLAGVNQDQAYTRKSTMSVGCQTETTNTTETQTSDQSDAMVGNTAGSSFQPDEKFCAVLIEMAGLMSATMGQKFRCVMASNVIKKHYGKVIDAERIELNMSGEQIPKGKGKKHKWSEGDGDQEVATHVGQASNQDQETGVPMVEEKRRRVRSGGFESEGEKENEMEVVGSKERSQELASTRRNQKVKKRDNPKAVKNVNNQNVFK